MVFRPGPAFVAPFLTGQDPDMLARVEALHADATREDNLYTAEVAAISAAQLLLRPGRFEEALTWVRQSATDCAAMGLRENFLVAEVLGCALALADDMPAAARTFAAAETQHVRGGMRWPTLAVTEALVDAVASAVGRRGVEQARAAAASLRLPDLATT